MTNIFGKDVEHVKKNVLRIPIRNIWLLMLYASDLFRQMGHRDTEVEDNPEEIPDLVAEILVHEVEQRLCRNLSMGYQTRSATLSRVRGRIDILLTTSHQLLELGRVACQFQEMTLDTPRHRYVRCALERLSPLIRSRSLAEKCNFIAMNLRRQGIIGVYPNPGELLTVMRFGRHDAADKPMVDAAKLAFQLMLPTEETGQQILPSPADNIHWMRKLFEKSIVGFYRVNLNKNIWHVTAGKKLKWKLTEKSIGSRDIFPSMKSDIIIEHKISERRVIIDTKFNEILSKGWYRDETLRNNYIYQIYTYLRTQESDADPLSINSTGLLLHPAVGYMLNEFIITQGHKIHFATVDLSTDAKTIKKQLLGLIHDCIELSTVTSDTSLHL